IRSRFSSTSTGKASRCERAMCECSVPRRREAETTDARRRFSRRELLGREGLHDIRISRARSSHRAFRAIPLARRARGLALEREGRRLARVAWTRAKPGLARDGLAEEVARERPAQALGEEDRHGV